MKLRLTRKHFDGAVKGLASQQSVDELADKLSALQQSLNGYSAALAALATDVKTLLDEKTVSAHRFDRPQRSAQKVGDRLAV
jgi:hypothetical protein